MAPWSKTGGNRLWLCAEVALVLAAAGAARAQDDPQVAARLNTIAAQLQAQQTLLEQQQHKINDQGATIAAQQRLIDTLRLHDDQLAASRAAGVGGGGGEAVITARADSVPAADGSGAAQPDGPQPNASPVGQPPPQPAQQAQLQGLPEGMAVLTPRGHFVLEPSVEYDNASSDRLIFRGVEIVPGIQIGVIEANNAASNTIISTASMRYSPLNRLELELRAPFVDRRDRITTVAQQNDTVTQTMDLAGDHLGDIEGTVRYQINRGLNGAPVFIGSLRVKSTTGRGPYDVGFDENGVATELPTGSGFWAVEPGLTVLYPTDPAVLFANISYVDDFGRNVNRTIGTTTVGQVNPGDAITGALGFGFSINQRFSYSLGYRHEYIFPTTTFINDTRQRSTSLQIGQALFTMSYLFTPRLSVSANFALGVTADAPDAQILLRVPFVF